MKEIDVDSFAGGGGASLGIETATGRAVDIAINHDAEAMVMHRANHPWTTHYVNDIWSVDPGDVVGRHGPIRLAWFSPDCTHFSKAKGRAPIRPHERRSRDLAWVVVKWAQNARPRIIMLENVEEFPGWAPLLSNGLPDPDRKGETFNLWIAALRKAGYVVEWRELRACDYGSPTVRKRLFLVARRDGQPIVWPEPTHGPGLEPYMTAADCIDWSIPVHSIFLTKEEGRLVGCKRPLAEATMKRIARGVFKYVLQGRPFIVPITHHGDSRVQSVDEPLRTITTAHRGELSVAMAHLMPYRGTKRGGHPRARDLRDPVHTVTTEPSAAVVAAFLAQHNTGLVGHGAQDPMSTIVGRGSTQGLVTAHLTRHFGGSTGQRANRPAPTTTAGGGGKTGLVTAHLMHQYTSNTRGGQGDPNRPLKTITTGEHHALVEAFLVKYYGTAVGARVSEPAPTCTVKPRFGLVTVEGADYQIVDIGMRMLTPRELYNAQGFPLEYEIAPEYLGKPLTKTAQIRLCGNSVCPQVAEALVRANLAAELAVASA